MEEPKELSTELLRKSCDPDALGFSTTAEITSERTPFGHERAIEAARFGLGIDHPGYNVFAMGPSGLGKRTKIEAMLAAKAAHEPPPADRCYVHNFQRPDRPCALELPAGRGAALQRDMAALVESLKAAVPTAFESEEYQNRLQEIEEDVRESREQAMETVAKEAGAQGMRMVRTPGGFAFAPVRGEEIIGPEEFAKLSEKEQAEIKTKIQNMQELAQSAMREAIRFGEEARKRVKALNREVALAAVGDTIAALRASWVDLPAVTAYLDAVETDMVEHADEFRPQPEQTMPFAGMLGMQAGGSSHRYRVNVLLEHAEDGGAPVVYEDHPTYQNLVGRVEHRAQFGALETDFTLIKAGALHRANGGYLILDARKLLMQPYAWEGLKSALRTRTIRIESLGEALSLVSTVTIQPEEIPLAVKVVLLGDRMLYYALHQYDPEFSELFKIAADFDESVSRGDDAVAAYAAGIAGIVREQGLRPFDNHAVARIIDAGARDAGDAEKLTLHDAWLQDLVREADFVAREDDCDVVTSKHVESAIDLKIRRSDRVRSLIYEAIERETVLIDTQGEAIGQVNGLSVLAVGDFAFGQPSRITATARLGQGRVVDIEREVKLGGAYHSKGVLILSNFLADRYARERPLALSASLVFEQSYAHVDGDSASAAELCALLSALADAPLKQSRAITGAVNQRGHVQAIGGVNEKIEGFFDVCNVRGLTGNQGVVIPHANIKHLMLRSDVVDAVAAGRFHVWAVETVDEALEVLTGVQAGERGADGDYPQDTLNRRVDDKLEHFYQLRKKMPGGAAEGGAKQEDEK